MLDQLIKLEVAKDYITRYSKQLDSESEPDFSDMSRIDLAYTGDVDNWIQVYVNLVDFTLVTEVNEEVIKKENYNNIDDLVSNLLINMDFDTLISDGVKYLSNL